MWHNRRFVSNNKRITNCFLLIRLNILVCVPRCDRQMSHTFLLASVHASISSSMFSILFVGFGLFGFDWHGVVSLLSSCCCLIGGVELFTNMCVWSSFADQWLPTSSIIMLYRMIIRSKQHSCWLCFLVCWTLIRDSCMKWIVPTYNWVGTLTPHFLCPCYNCYKHITIWKYIPATCKSNGKLHLPIVDANTCWYILC